MKEFLLIIFCLLEVNASLLKEIPQGRLQGTTLTSRLGRKYNGYLKIPYAKPPVGDLRFRAPVKAGKWKGVRDATKDDGVRCPQRNIGTLPVELFVLKGEEDCLYLNVYTPSDSKKLEESESEFLARRKKKYPVLIWIHGGAWEFGSFTDYRENHLMDKDIVIVAMNYRLGPLGFASMEDKNLHGNWGLKDQNMAMKWVKENIKYFGGNPDMVTIFGQSAGSSSVHYHMISPLSKGLFHRAISNSGTIFTSWALPVPGENRNRTLKMAKLLNCPMSPSRAVARCLRSKPMPDIIKTDVHFLEWYLDPQVVFKPVIEKEVGEDEAFLPEHPLTMIEGGKLAKVPWLVGYNSAEGSTRVAGIYNDSYRVQEVNDRFIEIVPISNSYKDRSKNVVEDTKKIRQFYFQNEPVDNRTIQEAIDLWTDAWFGAGTDHSIRLQRKYAGSPVYHYYFDYMGTYSFRQILGNPDKAFGVCHCDDTIYLFNDEAFFPKAKYSKADKDVMGMMVQLWTDFIIHGEPSPPSSPLSYHWDPVQTDQIEYAHITDRLEMEHSLHTERILLWRNLNFF